MKCELCLKQAVKILDFGILRVGYCKDHYFKKLLKTKKKKEKKEVKYFEKMV